VAELLDTLALHTPKFVSLIRPEFTNGQQIGQNINLGDNSQQLTIAEPIPDPKGR
jgi:hypothetical protein